MDVAFQKRAKSIKFKKDSSFWEKDTGLYVTQKRRFCSNASLVMSKWIEIACLLRIFIETYNILFPFVSYLLHDCL